MSLSPNFVNVTVNLPPAGVSGQTFNMGLIVGESTVISTADRVKEYANLQEMLDDGFANNDPEYLAATAYFAATSHPTKVAIGRRDAEAPETSLEALEACRAANTDWYAAFDTSAVDADQAANAAYFETLTAPFSQYFLQSSTSAISAGTGGNLFETLKGGKYSRTHGAFSSSTAAAAAMGYAMGQASNLARSYYTLKFKTLPGVTAEALTETQVGNIEGNNGNVYVTRGAASLYEQGKNFSGQFFDEVLGLDMLANAIGVNVTNLLLQTPALPQTEGGVSQLRTVIGKACDVAVQRGFLAPGQWTGNPVLTLNTGDQLPAGYLVLSQTIESQSDTDRSNRLAPPIYVCIKEAGAIHSTVIQVNVNR